MIVTAVDVVMPVDGIRLTGKAQSLHDVRNKFLNLILTQVFCPGGIDGHVKGQLFGTEITPLITLDGLLEAIHLRIEVSGMDHLRFTFGDLLLVILQRTLHGWIGCHYLYYHSIMALL